MRREIRFLILIVVAAYLSPAVAHAQTQQLSDKEKARIREQVDALKNAKLKEAEAANQQVKQDAIRKGEAIDKKVNQQSEQVDRAAENISPRFGSDFAKTLGDAKKQELQAKAKAEKERVIKDARKAGATNTGAAKKSADDIDKSVEGLKSQVSKSGQFGLKPKGSSVYVRNYGGKSVPAGASSK